MNDTLKEALSARLTALVDDELILGHRDSEWCGHAPILEEDIAFANIALDEIGHAGMWLEALAELLDEDPETYPNRMIYLRNADAFRCVQLVELPKGDWAFTMVRQYLFDAYEAVLMERLADSAFQPFADAAAKLRKEEVYHLRHTGGWVRRLGLGTEESQRRMQTAVDALWPFALQLFEPLPGDDDLIAEGIFPAPGDLQESWQQRVVPHLQEADLQVPGAAALPWTDRTTHTEHLVPLLAEMQKVARLDPEAEW